MNKGLKRGLRGTEGAQGQRDRSKNSNIFRSQLMCQVLKKQKIFINEEGNTAFTNDKFTPNPRNMSSRN